MDTDAITNGDGRRTQVGPDPLDYVLRYAAGDYDCYHQGRYIGSRATLAKAVEAVGYEQAKAARHPQPSSAADPTIAAYHDELRAIAVRLRDLAGRFAIRPTERVLISAHLTMAHIRITQAIKNLQDAERSCALARRAPDLATPLDAATSPKQRHREPQT
jgi:hypothetical protein